jgi:FkbM family methyltransferase
LNKEKPIKLLLNNKAQPIKIEGSIYQNNYSLFEDHLNSILRSMNNNEDYKIEVPYIRIPLQLRANSTDLFTFWKIFINEDYGFFINIKPKLIIDGGANIGCASVFFANRFPDANIIAVEPEMRNFRMLQLNTSFYPNVKLINAGIWNKNTHLKINDVLSREDAYTVEQTDSRIPESCSAITIEEILKNSSYDEIDILKLDIEGSEKEVFSSNYEAWLDKVNIIILELHDWIKKGCSEALMEALKDYNFYMSCRGENIIFIRPDIVRSTHVKIHFTCKLNDGSIIDTSIGHEPLQFTVGNNQVIAGLEQEVLGMNTGESKTFTVPPNRAFGLYDKELVCTITKEQFPQNIKPEIGSQLSFHENNDKESIGTVINITELNITLDTNHPLAGKDLIFNVQLLEIY